MHKEKKKQKTSASVMMNKMFKIMIGIGVLIVAQWKRI